ncbi:MAG: hypothetical protein A2234_01810 [Elusimicrobia bacterium RIFOXYA2_FULL_58_8]|nr:MAG: hypothetical protein A2234_01810 [Elusimicrobia bacterium RIFOXYA2_FULL_58_8]
MAKKHDKQQSAAQPGPGNTQSPAPAAESRGPGAQPAVTNGQLTAFWGVVAALIAASWLLDYILPGVHERVIERWLMLPFGAFLVFFLFRLK